MFVCFGVEICVDLILVEPWSLCF
ncbi:unnamed protein product, partial [Cylindrotheca closterium]